MRSKSSRAEPMTDTTAPARDLMSKFDPLIAERQALIDSGVTDPFAIVMEQVKSPTEAVIEGKDTILLGTYNYMGMTFDPDVVQAGKDALDQFGSEIGRASCRERGCQKV